MKKIRNLKTGFTLAELLVAISILAVALSSLLLFFTKAMMLNDSNRSYNLACSHGQFIMEEIRATDFFNIGPQITAGNWNLTENAIRARGLTALKNETVNVICSGSDLINVTLTVNWRDRDQRSRNVSLHTAFADL